MNKVYLVYGNHYAKSKKSYNAFYDGRIETTLTLLAKCLTFLNYKKLQAFAENTIKKIKLNTKSPFPVTLVKQQDNLLKITFKAQSIFIPELTFQATVLAWFAIIQDKPVLVELAPGPLCFTYTLTSSLGRTINSCTYCCNADN